MLDKCRTEAWLTEDTNAETLGLAGNSPRQELDTRLPVNKDTTLMRVDVSADWENLKSPTR